MRTLLLPAALLLLGRRVRPLFEGLLPARQPHTFVFDADHLPVGLYLYRVQGASGTATRQVLLVR